MDYCDIDATMFFKKSGPEYWKTVLTSLSTWNIFLIIQYDTKLFLHFALIIFKQLLFPRFEVLTELNCSLVTDALRVFNSKPLMIYYK